MTTDNASIKAQLHAAIDAIADASTVRRELEEGIRQIEAGEFYTMADFEREFARWLT